MSRTVGILLLFQFLSLSAVAQNEVFRERSSLQGINEFGVTVTIESPSSVSHGTLNPVTIRESISESFKELSATILTDRDLRESDQYPLLSVHINIMKASNGTFPYAIELNFYQPVKLPLQGDLLTTGVTWNSSQIGIVSENNLHLIAEETVYASSIFKEAYQIVN